MPERKTIARARAKARKGRTPSTQAGEFVREEMHHIREGKHGARSSKQAIAIGLSKARRAGVKLPARGRRKRPASRRVRASGRPSPRRSRAILGVLRREGRSAASPRALARQGRSVAARRGVAARRRAALLAVRTKGPRLLRQEARKAARARRYA